MPLKMLIFKSSQLAVVHQRISQMMTAISRRLLSTDPASAKRMRRMLSNRKSARRSRKRKQAHLNGLQSQVSRLTAENASLLKRLADMTQKYEEATLDNRNLKVDVETMRTKVNIAEEAVRRVTGTSLLLLSTTSDKPGSSMPFSSCLSDAASASVPIEESMNNFLQVSLEVQDGQIKPHLSNAAAPVTVTSGEMDAMPASPRRVTSLENPQKRIRGDSVCSVTGSTFSDSEALANDKYHEV